MNKNFVVAGLIAFAAVMLIPALGFASDGGAGGKYEGFNSYIAVGCVIGLGLAAAGGGIGMGNAVSGAVNAMARNPGFYGRIFTNMLIGLALIESLVIYTLVVVLILLYANPFIG